MSANCEKSLYERLTELSRSDFAAFHMPGHKRQVGKAALLPEGLPWQIDITEIDGFDNLHHAEGILKDSMERAAACYGVSRSLYSINGSTAGILSAIFSVTQPGGAILMARNCHKSVYHAVFLQNLRPYYLYPQVDEATGLACGYLPEDVSNMLTEHPEISAVIITSPTYEGIVSDVKAIAEAAHQGGVPLIVDEAHGAHLPVGKTLDESGYFPCSAVCQGADLVIQSLHKTLPSLTQTAILHVCGNLADDNEAARYMSMFQTSSPSYVLMASIDSCIAYRFSDQGKEDFKEYEQRLRVLRSHLHEYRYIHLIEPEKAEPSKLVLTADGLNGHTFYELLREQYHLQPEMCTGTYVLLMTSVADTPEMYERLCRALDRIDEQLCSDPGEYPKGRTYPMTFHRPVQIYTPAQADRMKKEVVDFNCCEGRISAEYAYQYPPGIPMLVPGERIDAQALAILREVQKSGLEIQGLKDMDAGTIEVIAE